jgi:hypothetical protein
MMGFKTLIEVAEIAGTSTQVLRVWAKSKSAKKRRLWLTVITGAKLLKEQGLKGVENE